MSLKLTSTVRAIALTGMAAAALAGCGSSFKSVPGSSVPAPTAKPIGFGVVDQAPLPHTKCMRAAGLQAVRVGPATIQVGSPPAGPTVVFAPDPNAAEAEQIQGVAQGAEVIGASVLYVHSASDTELSKVEACLRQGVAG
ncbi:MAG: hypothetical protein M3071_19720 [Actinomycetota bacterium]|nr:hypothetical protein [Actinomycetota bacterium]